MYKVDSKLLIMQGEDFLPVLLFAAKEAWHSI